MGFKQFKSTHMEDIMHKLNEERKSGNGYCDVTLTAGDDEFSSHKCILGAFSSFYRKLFSSEMKEKYESKANIHGVKEDTMEAVLNFMYTCEVVVTSENVYSLLEAANYLQIPNLKQYCIEFLLDEIDVTNCLTIQAYSKMYDLDQVVTKANIVIAENFESVIDGKEFKELTPDVMFEVMQVEDKKVSSEENVFHALIGWAKHDVATRKKHMVKLFGFVKLGKLSWNFLQDVALKEDLIMTSVECTNILLLSAIPRAAATEVLPAPSAKEALRNQFLAFHGKNVWKYDVRKKEASDFLNTNFEHLLGSAVCHKSEVFVIGGDESKVVERLKLNDKESGWTQLASTNVLRLGAASVVCNDTIFTAGGRKGGGGGLTLCESYNIVEDKWHNSVDMNEGRNGLALASTGGLIYAVGGYNRVWLNTVECMDPREGWWRGIPSMKVKRCGFPAVVLNDQVYAIGGFDDNWSRRSSDLSSVERFDPRKQAWSDVADMNVARCFHGSCVIDGMVYVAGGRTDAIETYDAAKNTWEVVGNVKAFNEEMFIVGI